MILFGTVWSLLYLTVVIFNQICFSAYHCLKLILLSGIQTNTDGIAEGSTNVQECKWKTDMS